METQVKTTTHAGKSKQTLVDKKKIAKRLRATTEGTMAKIGPNQPLIERFFSTEGVHPYDQLEWEKRIAVIAGEDGADVFRQEGVEVPATWSQMATNIVASKYFRGQVRGEEREWSVKQLINRVADTIGMWGLEQGYFADEAERDTFIDELKYLLVNQYAAFNSPVWFNCGVEPQPQVSACFINSVDDDLRSIMNLAVTEGSLFKYGSGTGTNFSKLRSSIEELSGGGIASGPVSFMKGFDSFAGVIKSGGKTRRAAKMVMLDIDHPDVEEFISSKANEEKKAWALIESGYDGSFNGEAYRSVYYQNANHSIRVSDEFMNAVNNDDQWPLQYVSKEGVAKWVRARDLMDSMADAAYICGDPGIQYDSTINKWHTCKASGRINASNPCSEYMFLDDSACNLASLNLMKFLKEDGGIDTLSLRKAVNTIFTAQEIAVDKASYPTEKITINSKKYRPIGLGYANLGAYVMHEGLPYDSDQARAYAAAITAIVGGQSYLTSAHLAAKMKPFDAYEPNSESMLHVMEQHKNAVATIEEKYIPVALKEEALTIWQELVEQGKQYGYRNAQATVLAPTGTIGFLMDCDTTGIEPDIALVKYKQLVGGGTMKLVNTTVPAALAKLGYDKSERTDIMAYIEEQGTIEGAPHILDEHLPVFDCALAPANGERSIEPMGHVRMMSAVQPFLSGAISKTVNMPSTATAEDIKNVYMDSWKLGLKAIAIYRDGSKRTQPLGTSREVSKKEEQIRATLSLEEMKKLTRRKMPDERQAITHKFSIGGHEGYITVGMFEDNTPGEIFIVMSKEGSTISGLMDSFATAVSLALQYGVPLEVMVDKFSHSRFEPAGFTGNPSIPIAKSVMDYIFRWLESKFLVDVEDENHVAAEQTIQVLATADKREAQEPPTMELYKNQVDAPACATCGSIMVRNGSCYRCSNCGNTSGCS